MAVRVSTSLIEVGGAHGDGTDGTNSTDGATVCVGTIELDRPERRNALNVATCRQLVAAVAEVTAADVRAVLVTGRGSSFCAGADFGEVYGEGFRTALHAALRAVRTLPVPVVAAVNGPAIGAGTQLALACDLRVGAPGAVFALPTARLGLAVDPWTIRRLAHLAGGGTARSMLLACDQVGVELAHSRGLVDRLGERADAESLVAELATLAPLTLAYNKLVLDRAGAEDEDPGLLAALERCWSSTDLTEGRAARQENRAPVFRGTRPPVTSPRQAVTDGASQDDRPAPDHQE